MAQAQPNEFERWYRSLPIITKSYMTGCVLTTIAVHLELINPLSIWLNFRAIITQYQVWRVVTNFLFFDFFGLNFILHMYFLVRHSKMLEENYFRGKTGDYFYMWLFGATNLTLIAYLFYCYPQYFPKLMFLGSSLEFMIVYVWSKRAPLVWMNFLGLFSFTAPYLPWVIVGITILLQQSPMYDILGAIVGHLYYFLVDVYPERTGRHLLKTPKFIKYIFHDDDGWEDIQVQPVVPPVVPPAPGPGGETDEHPHNE